MKLGGLSNRRNRSICVILSYHSQEDSRTVPLDRIDRSDKLDYLLTPSWLEIHDDTGICIILNCRVTWINNSPEINI